MDFEKPWDSTYQYQCKKKMFDEHKQELGDDRATALANVWANYHFLGEKVHKSYRDRSHIT